MEKDAAGCPSLPTHTGLRTPAQAVPRQPPTLPPVRFREGLGVKLPRATRLTGNGFTDLVVGNNGDGVLALLMGGSGGLSLSQTVSSPEAPSPTSVSFAGVSNGLLDFYVSTAGVEAAMNLAFNLEEGAGLGPDGAGSAPGVSLSGGHTHRELIADGRAQ